MALERFFYPKRLERNFLFDGKSIRKGKETVKEKNSEEER